MLHRLTPSAPLRTPCLATVLPPVKASALSIISVLALSIGAVQPSAATSAQPTPTTTSTPAAQPTTTKPTSTTQPASTPATPATPTQKPLSQPDQGTVLPPSHLRIPAALVPYLDPGFHPDLRFEPDLPPTNADTQALRLEIRLSRREVTLYRGDTPLKSYAIAVGRPGWETPVGTYEVKQMIKNPTWVHPLEKGVVIPGGDPENPLGRYWIGFWTDGKNWIGFHGTPTPRSVGRAASHGCIRMYNKDVEELFKQVTLGTVVTVVK